MESLVDSLEEPVISLRRLESRMSQVHGVHFQQGEGSHKGTHSNSIHEYFTNPSDRKVLSTPLPIMLSQLIEIGFVFRCRLFSWPIEHSYLVSVTCSAIGSHGAYSADSSQRCGIGGSNGMSGRAREGRRDKIYPSISIACTNPCLNRSASGTFVLVSIRGRCRFTTLVRPIIDVAHCV